MKYLALICSLALVGCEATDSMAMLGGNMLETAPQTDYDVMYPEWGVVQ
ncbi:OmpA family protein, partial [Vibrio fortis]